MFAIRRTRTHWEQGCHFTTYLKIDTISIDNIGNYTGSNDIDYTQSVTIIKRLIELVLVIFIRLDHQIHKMHVKETNVCYLVLVSNTDAVHRTLPMSMRKNQISVV